MPSLRSKQRFHHQVCLGLGSILLSSLLISCGSGESEARITNPPPEISVPKPKNFDIKVPVEMRDMVVKVFDNFDNSLILEQDVSTTTDLSLVLPRILNREHLYRVELSSKSNSLIYNFLNGQYQNYSNAEILHALVEVNISNLHQTIYLNPNSEAIYQRALVRSGQLPTDKKPDPMQISALQLRMASTDVNTALLNAFNNLDIQNLAPSYLLSAFTPQDGDLGVNLYTKTYFSFGYLQQWAANISSQNTFTEFTKNLAIDLRDGYLDGKTLRGDTSLLKSLITPSPDNIDPAQNTLLKIFYRQQNTRDQYATSLKQSVLQLANNYQQATLNPTGYAQLQQQAYADTNPIYDSNQFFRVAGAGDYRRAVGFVDTTDTCNGSIYPCKQGITGINLVDPSLPSIEYLIGHYQAQDGCQLNIRADGWLELISKDNQIFRSKLDGDTTDNLLQVDKTASEYLLNSSSPQPTDATAQYPFVQIHIKANQVLSASAGLDLRKAPDQLQTIKLQCNFN